MKNLLIYLNSERKFDEETSTLVKIQIDNSLDLGWKKEDILLITNFDYKYNGITATIVLDELFCTFYKYVSKINVLVHFFACGMIEKGQVYWLHDFDAYENSKIDELEVKEELGGVDVGFTSYGRGLRLNCGSFFFKDSAGDVFNWIKDKVYENAKKWKGVELGVGEYKDAYRRYSEELALEQLIDDNTHNINSRIKKINYSYNFGMRNLRTNYVDTLKPIRVLHFHPHNELINTLAIAMYGKNRLKMPLMSERLIKIFHHYGIK